MPTTGFSNPQKSNLVDAYHDPYMTVEMGKATTTDEFAAYDLIEADSLAGTCKVVNNADKSAFVGLGLNASHGTTAGSAAQ